MQFYARHSASSFAMYETYITGSIQLRAMYSAPSSRHVKSVQTGFRIVHVLQDHDGATLNELAERLGLAKSTVHNYLSTLESMGYVVNQEGTYRLGLRFLTHGMAAKSGLNTREAVEETLSELAGEVSQPVWWITEEFGRGIFVDNAVPADCRRIYGRTGKRSYLHTHAPGKAILAVLPEDDREEILEYHGLPVHTTRTVEDRSELAAQLAAIRDQGYAFSDGEAVLGVQSVGVAFEAPGGRWNALGVFGYSHDLGDERLEEDVPSLLQSAAADLVGTLGGDATLGGETTLDGEATPDGEGTDR